MALKILDIQDESHVRCRNHGLGQNTLRETKHSEAINLPRLRPQNSLAFACFHSCNQISVVAFDLRKVNYINLPWEGKSLTMPVGVDSSL